MPRLQCPRCATIIDVDGAKPVCPQCGFGKEAGGGALPRTSGPAAATGQAIPAGDAAVPVSAAQAAVPSDPWTSEDPARGRQPGTPRPAWLIVILYIVTFGIYGFYWHWVTGKEIDRFRPGTNAFPLLKWSVILGIINAVLAFVLAIAFFAVVFAAISDAESSEDVPDDAELFALLATGGAFLIGLFVIVTLLGTAQVVLTYMGMWRVWKATEAEQHAIGHASPVNPGMLLGLLLGYQFLGLLSNGIQAALPIIGAFIGFFISMAALAAGIIAYVWTQNGLNSVWAAYGRRV